MTKTERCFFWFITACFLSMFATHISYANRREVINAGCQNIGKEFSGTNVFDGQEQISRFDVVGREKESVNGEEYSIEACQTAFDQIKNKYFLTHWGVNTAIYWALLTIGFHASENKAKTGF